MRKDKSFIGRRVAVSEQGDEWWFAEQGRFVVVAEGTYDHTCRHERLLLHKKGERFILVDEEYDKADPANFRRNTIREWAVMESWSNPCNAAQGTAAFALRVAGAAR